MARDVGAPHRQAWTMAVWSDLDLAECNLTTAGAGRERSFQGFRKLGDRSCTARTLSRLSRFERAGGDQGRSVSLLVAPLPDSHRGSLRDSMRPSGQ